MYLRLQKIDRAEKTWRWYELNVQRTLFGEWAVVREWDRMRNTVGQRQYRISTPCPTPSRHTMLFAFGKQNEDMLLSLNNWICRYNYADDFPIGNSSLYFSATHHKFPEREKMI